MSKRKIVAALKRKNIYPLSVEFQRSCPTPYGYATGWDLEFSEELEELIYDLDCECKFNTFMEFDDLNTTLEWIKTLPVVVTTKGENDDNQNN